MLGLRHKILNMLSRLFVKKNEKNIDEFADYTNFYWTILENIETKTTQNEDLPGFSEYHKMLKTFLKAQPIYDQVEEDVVDVEHADYSYVKVTNWLKSQESAGQHKAEEVKFSDVHSFIDHHLSEECTDQGLHYACVDVTAYNSEVNTSFEGTFINTSTWEVTRKRSTLVRASEWLWLCIYF